MRDSDLVNLGWLARKAQDNADRIRFSALALQTALGEAADTPDGRLQLALVEARARDWENFGQSLWLQGIFLASAHESRLD